jgi:hypothetical protein
MDGLASAPRSAGFSLFARAIGTGPNMARTFSLTVGSWILCAFTPTWSFGASAPLASHDVLTSKPQQFWVKPKDGPDGFRSAPTGAIQAMRDGSLNNLERDMAYLLVTKEQLPDGTFRLETIPSGFMNSIRANGTNENTALEPIRHWRKAMPESAEAPIFEAMTWNALAWAARGNTYSTQVDPAAKQIFKTSAMQAANVLNESKARSSINPLWYLVMLQVGRDLSWDRTHVQAILKEGMARFPEFHALPREMVIYLSPKWYGDYDQERTFIEKTVAAAPKDQQAELYTRLYLKLQDTMGLSSANVFAATGVSWSRMRLGFEDMAQRYPQSLWNRNHYAAWACIAGDKSDYTTARSGLGTTIYPEAWFPNNPLEVCDRRLHYTQQGAFTLPSSDYKRTVNPRVNDGPAADAWIGRRYAWLFETQAFAELDSALAQASASLNQTDDGSFHVYTAGEYLSLYFVTHASSADAFEAALAHWRQNSPQSVGEPIVESIYWRGMGELLRRRSSARDDSKEGARLFRERLRKAQDALTASRERSAGNPLWYAEQIRVGRDLGWGKDQLLKVYKEGIAKYPGFEPLAGQMAVGLLPMWGGSYLLVEKFAAAQAQTLGKEAGDERYTRIYWNINHADQCVGTHYCMIFNSSTVSWPHMRQGFEAMISRYPKSLWNANNYAAFACLAKDKETYANIRPKLGQDKDLFRPAWPTNATPEVCDQALLSMR